MSLVWKVIIKDSALGQKKQQRTLLMHWAIYTSSPDLYNNNSTLLFNIAINNYRGLLFPNTFSVDFSISMIYM